jgi:Polyketide cyclase / dehydrase and lipid transport
LAGNVGGATVIHAEAESLVSRTMPETFSALVDFANYPTWMEACVRLSQTSPGELGSGAALHYVHNTGGRKGEMSGVVTTFEHDRMLKLNFEDSAFAVDVGFSTEAVGDGTRVMHFIDIDPKSLFGRLFAPIIRKGNAKQVSANLRRFKILLESSG